MWGMEMASRVLDAPKLCKPTINSVIQGSAAVQRGKTGGSVPVTNPGGGFQLTRCSALLSHETSKLHHRT